MQFNPNKPGMTKNYFFATFIPDRRPQFKMYSNRGHALNAFQYKDEGILYEWDTTKNEWEEIYREEKDGFTHETCDVCGDSMMRDIGGRSYKFGQRIWVDRDTDKPHRIQVHYNCKYA